MDNLLRSMKNRLAYELTHLIFVKSAGSFSIFIRRLGLFDEHFIVISIPLTPEFIYNS